MIAVLLAFIDLHRLYYEGLVVRSSRSNGNSMEVRIAGPCLMKGKCEL